MNHIYLLIMIALYSYMLGCFCAAYYLVRYLIGKDIRVMNSGTVGANNAGRILGLRGFIVVAALDIFKGWLAITITKAIYPGHLEIIISMIMVVIGHLFPAQLKFQGGKGLAVFFGALIAINAKLALLSALLIVILKFTTANNNLATFITLVVTPFLARIFIIDQVYLLGISITSAVLIVINLKKFKKL